MKVKGKSLMIRVAGHTIALATSCTFTAQLNTIDARTFESSGADVVADFVGWSISSESILGLNPGTEQQTFDSLMRLFLAKRPVQVEVFLAANAEGRVPVDDWHSGPSAVKGFAPYQGEALIKSVALKGDTGNSAQISLQLDGLGELTEIEQVLTSRVEGNTLIIEGPASVERGEILIDGNLTITDNTIEL